MPKAIILTELEIKILLEGLSELEGKATENGMSETFYKLQDKLIESK